jgi:predicted SnoaL-like aldol condensation-catalyzing enzyme
MNDQLEQNKKRAIAFYELMFNQGQPAEAIEDMLATPIFSHHPRRRDNNCKG